MCEILYLSGSECALQAEEPHTKRCFVHVSLLHEVIKVKSMVFILKS